LPYPCASTPLLSAATTLNIQPPNGYHSDSLSAHYEASEHQRQESTCSYFGGNVSAKKRKHHFQHQHHRQKFKFQVSHVYACEFVAKPLDLRDLSLNFGFGLKFHGAKYIEKKPVVGTLANKGGDKVLLYFLSTYA
jgi:hypothetical protein